MKDHYAAAEADRARRERDEPTATANVVLPGDEPDCRATRARRGHAQAAALDAETLAAVRRSMAAAPADFWSVVGQTELNMYASLGAARWPGCSRWRRSSQSTTRVSAPKMWASVYDNAPFVLPRYQTRAAEAEAGSCPPAARGASAAMEVSMRRQPAGEGACPCRGPARLAACSQGPASGEGERSRLRGRQRPGARPPARKAAKGRAKKPGRSTR